MRGQHSLDLRPAHSAVLRTLARVAIQSAPLFLAVLMLQLAAPRYLLQQGFPLDDAWIHAVYAREVARNGTLAYNPGVPATGETAPLWALGTRSHLPSADGGSVTLSL